MQIIMWRWRLVIYSIHLTKTNTLGFLNATNGGRKSSYKAEREKEKTWENKLLSNN